MGNPIMVAKNTFGQGLLMDFAPDNTQANHLTSALNATFITFNGNEMSLLNDMGNARVETARLPDGYIPVGTCEFGDIIYVVSYNPILNKSQIGCFPSPERTISSEETGNAGQIITASDFLEIKNNKPTGKLIANSKKYILYNKSLNPGDKYIIYSSGESIEGNNQTITDLGNESKQYGTLPRLLKLHVVSIEDSGKIVFLDSDVKWYDKDQLSYFIQNSMSKGANSTGKIDIDSYRSLVSSAYSVFKSKVSGQLAILAELEKINGFSCTYDIYADKESVKNGITSKDYKVFFEFNWQTDDENINPSHIVLTKSQWVNIKENENELDKIYLWVNESGKRTDKRLDRTSITLPKAYPTSDYWYAPITNYNRDTTFKEKDKSLIDSFGNTSYYKPNEEDDKNNYITNFINTCYTTRAKQFKEIHPEYIGVTVQRTENGLPIIGSYYPKTSKGLKTIKNNENYDIVLNQDEEIPVSAVSYVDTLINNYFKSSVYKEFTTFKIPITYTQEINGVTEIYNYNKSNLVYQYQITPAMPYGLLDEYAIDGYIDFSKIGTGDINVSQWRYYNQANLLNLSLGIDAYPEPNKGISEIVLEFYDNQGFAAAYHITDRESYSGVFTESIPLNNTTQTPKLNSIDALGVEHIHIGSTIDEQTYNEDPSKYLKVEKGKILEWDVEDIASDGCYINDAGTLYSNVVYLTKIVVKYSHKNSLNEYVEMSSYEDTTYYRWLWTNTLYNEQYYTTTDFNTLPLELVLDVAASFKPGKDYSYVKCNYAPPITTSASTTSNLSAIVQRTYGSIMYNITPFILNAHNTFHLNSIDGNFANLKARLYEGKTYVKNYPEIPAYKHSGESLSAENSLILPILQTEYPYNKTKLSALLLNLLKCTLSDEEIDKVQNNSELYDGGHQNYINGGTISIYNPKETQNKSEETEEIEETQDYPKETENYNYITYEQQVGVIKDFPYIEITLNDNSTIFKEDKKIDIDLYHFSKYYKESYNYSANVLVLRPILYTESDLTLYGLKLSGTDDIKHVAVKTIWQHYNYRDNSAHLQYRTNFILNGDLLSLLPIDTWMLDGRFDESGSDGYHTVYMLAEGQTFVKKRYRPIASMIDLNIHAALKSHFMLLIWAELTAEIKNNGGWWIDIGGTQVKYPLYQPFSKWYNENVLNKYKLNTDLAYFSLTGSAYSGYCLAPLVFPDSLNQFHVLNTAFLLPCTSMMVSQKYTTPAYTTNSTVQVPYYKGDGYDYYCFMIRGNNQYREEADELQATLKKFTNVDEYKEACYIGNRDHKTYVNIFRVKENTPNVTVSFSLLNNEGEIVENLINGETRNIDLDIEDLYNFKSFELPIEGRNVYEGLNLYMDDVPFKFSNESILIVRYPFETYVGDVITSLLQSIYTVLGEQNVLLQKVLDLVALQDNYTIIAKELICKTIVPESKEETNHDNFIALGEDINYSVYKKLLLRNIPNKNKINYSNVNVILKDCIKTIPLELKMDYLYPTESIVNDEINAVVYKANQLDAIPVSLSNIDSNALYELDLNNNVQKLSTNHIFEYAAGYKSKDTGTEILLLAIPSGYHSGGNRYLKKFITYKNGHFGITGETFDISKVYSKYFVVENEEGKYSRTAGLADNDIEHVLISDLQFIPTP